MRAGSLRRLHLGLFRRSHRGEAQKTILQYTYDLAKALGSSASQHQFILYDDQVYVIEVNPRSSRTIPYISKAPACLIDLATSYAGPEAED